ncbi:MAG: hypothetical protein KAS63_09025 [Candidatus Heimdallarchaeota archaeon]|nr:hypothetical protein [Candidatus Heimdallarchaeota archaeon]MCK4955491.1 hypothetical protein [Candidatus Heimdallarchaeota archaeon]
MKRKKLFFCLSLILILMMFSGSLLIRTQASLNLMDNVSQVEAIDKSLWFWTSIEILSQTDDDTYGHDLAIDKNDNIHVVFEDETDDLEGSGTDTDVFYIQWNAETRVWSNLETVSTESTALSNNPSIAVDQNGNTHVSWHDQTDILSAGPDGDVFYKRRTPDGTWTSTELVSTDSTSNLQQISIAIDNQGNPSITWSDNTDVGDLGGTDYDIFYNNLTIATSTWLGMTLVSTESDLGSYNPDVNVDEEGNIHLVWYDLSDLGSGTDDDIFYKKYSISEEDWSTIVFISSESTSDSRDPFMTIDNEGIIHIAWEDETNYEASGTDWDIFYKYSAPHLSTWTTTEVISVESTFWAALPSIAIDQEGTIHITWEDWTEYPGVGSDWDIYYKYRNTPSEDWSPLTLVSTDITGTSYIPSIVVDSLGHVLIAWYDQTDYNGAGSDWDVFYRKFVGPPEETTLYPISPNPSSVGNLTLYWDESFGAEYYDVYRDESYILSTSSLTPIASVSTTTFEDELNETGTYYYSIVASNYAAESELSNVESVEILSSGALSGFFGDFNWGEIIVIAGIVGAIQIILMVTLAILLKPSSTPKKKKK